GAGPPGGKRGGGAPAAEEAKASPDGEVKDTARPSGVRQSLRPPGGRSQLGALRPVRAGRLPRLPRSGRPDAASARPSPEPGPRGVHTGFASVTCLPRSPDPPSLSGRAVLLSRPAHQARAGTGMPIGVLPPGRYGAVSGGGAANERG